MSFTQSRPRKDEEGFRKQRRYLLVATLALLAFENTSGSLSRLSLFGNEIALDSPLNIVAPLWIAWAFFYLRFYQFFRDLGNLGIRDAYGERITRLIEADGRKQLEAIIVEQAGVQSARTKKFTFERINVAGSDDRTYTVEALGRAEFDDLPDGAGKMVMIENQRVHIPKGSKRRDLNAAWWVAMHTHLVTEYVLPFAVATAPLALLLWRATRRL